MRLLSLTILNFSATNEYADEEVQSSCTYPNSYKSKGITEQIKTLCKLFPELNDATFDESVASRPLSSNAEEWFAIPRWKKLGSTYGEAIEKVLATIKSKRTFCNYREGQTGLEHLCQHQSKTSAGKLQKLGYSQQHRG